MFKIQNNNQYSTMILLLTFSLLITVCAHSENVEPNIAFDDLEDKDSFETINGQPVIFTDCTRKCYAGAPKRICYYKWVLELYNVMGTACGNCSKGVKSDCEKPQCVPADGVERSCLTINRQIDGPSIDVCKDDLVVVDVSNMMEGIEESIHWHGILQNGYQFMDGVPMLTQCPIAYLNIFRYKFRVPVCGSFFYHSHSGLNKVNGIHGAFLVRCPQSEEIHGHLYDHDLPEHTIVLSDWLHVPASMHLPGSSHILNGIPENILINGRGRSTVNASQDLVPIPYTKLSVRYGEKYRIRIINSGTLICPFQINVEDHNMTVIATDGESCQPRMINTLTTYPGERYCVVIHANQPKSSYWIHVKPVGLCTNINKEISQSAILVYNSDQTIIPKTPRPNMTNGFPEGYNLNPPNCKSNKDYICVTELSYNGINDPDFFIRKADTVRYYEIKFVNNSIDNFFNINNYYPFRLGSPGRFAPEMGTINDKTMLFPSSPPLSQPIDPLTICNKSQIPAKCQRSKTCACPHIESIDMGLVVDLIVVNNEETNDVNNHPMHLHGHSFFVLLMGRFQEKIVFNEKTITQMYATGMLGEKSKHQPPLKDTIVIPSHGFAVIRFYTNNPGYWLFHCHFLLHQVTGMAMVFKMGDQYMLPPVPQNFPKCGNFMPTI